MHVNPHKDKERLTETNVCVCRFVLAAVSPAVVVPSMLLLQKEGYGVEKVILLSATGGREANHGEQQNITFSSVINMKNLSTPHHPRRPILTIITPQTCF